jgi:two-component system, sensor histidine kinase and response regulator
MQLCLTWQGTIRGKMFEPPSMPGLSSRADLTDLSSLVDCSYSIEKGATLEEVHRAFLKHGHEFMAVVEDGRLIGICSKSGIGMILGSRFGFAIFSKKSIAEHLLPSPVIIRTGTPLRNVLDTVFSRPSDEFYDDIGLIDDKRNFIGLIQVHSLVKLQHRLLLEKLQQVELQERNLRAANQQLERLAVEINAKNSDLARARDMALEGTRMKSEFLATMSHEIRTPMNGVIGMISLLMETPLTPEQMMYAKTVRSSGESLLDIINDILDFSKIEAGKMEISNHEFDIRELVESSLHLLVERAAAKGLELIWDVGHEVPVRGIADSTRMRQIIVNLAGNAVKFTDKGEVVLSARYDTDSDFLRIEVHDTGPGISEESLGKLFAPFTQADSSTTRKHGGTGLGLSISKRLTQLMGGRIGCTSKLGVGSLFWFEIPIGKATAQGRMPEFDFGSQKALILDDNATMRGVLCGHLNYCHLRCTPVCDAAEAMTALSSAHSACDPFTFLLADLAGESKAVADFCEAVHNDKRFDGMYIIGMTVVGNMIASKLTEKGVISRHLYKPIRFVDLCSSMEGLVKSTSTPDGDVMMRPSTLDISTAKPLRILIVEDTITNQVVARLLVEKIGHKCTIASNGLEALEVLRREPFDCVLMDCMMPEMDGFETTKRIRDGFCGEAQKEIHIIAMTANAMQGDRERCIEAGMDEYISKPVRRAELAARLENTQKLLYAR